MIIGAIIATVLFYCNAQNYTGRGKGENSEVFIQIQCPLEAAVDGYVFTTRGLSCSHILNVIENYNGEISPTNNSDDCIFEIPFQLYNTAKNRIIVDKIFDEVCVKNNNNSITISTSQTEDTRIYEYKSSCHHKIFKRSAIEQLEPENSSSSSEEVIAESIQAIPSGRYFTCVEERTKNQKWCATPVGRNTFPCETPTHSGNFTVRRCELVDNIPVWSEVENNYPKTSFTTLLNGIRNEITPSTLSNVSNVIQDNGSFLSVLDVDIIAGILNGTVNQSNKATYRDPFLNVVNNVLGIDKTLLRSTRKFGSTDRMLKSIDSFLLELSKETTTGDTVSLSNVAFEIVKPSVSSSHDHYNITFQGISVRIPNSILSTSILTVFKNDNFFPEGNVASEIADVKILGVNGDIDHPISIYLHTDPLLEVVCSFWKYDEQEVGNWSTEGVKTVRLTDDLVECESNHLTAFALLGISDRIIENLSQGNQVALQIISGTLCAFSLMGLIIIFITCFALKKWHKKRINTIQLSGVIALEIFMLFLNEIVTINDGLGCVLFGVLMHYVVLVKFTIMLLIAKMQYENFVTVLKSRNKSRNVLFSTLISFSIPILIVGISAGVFSENYNSGNIKFCYPKEEAFKYFVIIPIASIILANLIIFSLVMFKISRSISRDIKQKILQAKLAVMLFFMLGLSWIFSVFSHTIYIQWLQLIFIYIFSILSPLQGFVIFVFTIIMDADAKAFWMKCYNRVRYAPLETETSNNTTSTAVLMSNVSQSCEITSEERRLKPRKEIQEIQ